eukprot:TRINITY_DN10728_c0_g2_i1.p1 TRINITY_DN10728_c0_g2~~TRINITY_DN10728_c0_g2_i1.p1  ORF type:complete len:336 (-),score=31.12 TRINITY_DN10728_c0_g2_i1:35-1042(-)
MSLSGMTFSRTTAKKKLLFSTLAKISLKMYLMSTSQLRPFQMLFRYLKDCKFQSLRKVTCRDLTTQNQIDDWLTKIVECFLRVDLLGFDPFRMTPFDFKYYSSSKLEPFESVSGLASNSSLFERLQLSAYKERLLQIIGYEFDPFSDTQTTILHSILKSFADDVYVTHPAKPKENLVHIKELLTSLTTRFDEALKTCVSLPLNNEFGRRMLARNAKLLKNILRFEGVLPLSNIGGISMKQIFDGKIAPVLDSSPIPDQAAIIQQILTKIPAGVLANEKFTEYLLPLQRWYRATALLIEGNPSLKEDVLLTQRLRDIASLITVSYTHLTLPTIYSV